MNIDADSGSVAVHSQIEHLRVLTLRIAPDFPQDRELLNDLTATYKFLTDRATVAKWLLTPLRNEALFLNVNNPQEDRWQFRSAAQIMFSIANNIPDDEEYGASDDEGYYNQADDGNYQEACAFLIPFRPLLIAAGALEILQVAAHDPDPSPTDEELSSLRAAFEGLRHNRLLTDVVFRFKSDAFGDGAGVVLSEAWGHRALLATASEFFHDLFSTPGFIESGPASAERPIHIEMETLEEFHCAELVLGEHPLLSLTYMSLAADILVVVDYIYTGHFAKLRDRNAQITLLYLTHRWQMTRMFVKVEVMLVGTIDPWSYQTCMFPFRWYA